MTLEEGLCVIGKTGVAASEQESGSDSHFRFRDIWFLVIGAQYLYYWVVSF